MSNLGKWDSWYGRNSPEDFRPFGDPTTYHLAYRWLKSCTKIEDWGCGRAFFKTLCSGIEYIGIDGSCAPHADIVTDLTSYLSSSPGILIRHVLEHNLEWERILSNAIRSFTKRMALIIFTPFIDKTSPIAVSDNGIPNIAFSPNDLLSFGLPRRIDFNIPTMSQYGTEHILYYSKQ